MNFDQTPEFSKELKKFSKKWRSLPRDMEVFREVILTLYEGANGLPADHIRKLFFASKKGAVIQAESNKYEVVKVRVDCADLNKDILRASFIYSGKTITLVELYAKNEKSREDISRIQKYLKYIT